MSHIARIFSGSLSLLFAASLLTPCAATHAALNTHMDSMPETEAASPPRPVLLSNDAPDTPASELIARSGRRHPGKAHKNHKRPGKPPKNKHHPGRRPPGVPPRPDHRPDRPMFDHNWHNRRHRDWGWNRGWNDWDDGRRRPAPRHDDGRYRPNPRYDDGRYHPDPRYDDGQYRPRGRW